jgi:hypothetical protein
MAIIEMTFVLLLTIGQERLEYTPYQSLSECLSVRRKIKRNVGHSSNFDQKWSCKELRVKIQDGQILEIL